MTHFNPRAPRRIGLTLLALAGATMLLSACSDEDPILPGERLDVRAVLQETEDSFVQEAPEFQGNESRAIVLPKTRTNAAWTHSPGTPATRVAHAALSSAPQLIWSADIGQGDSRKLRITASPAVSKGRVFTLDASSVVTATSTSGAAIWSVDLRPERDQQGDATGGGLVVSGDTVYVSIGFGVLAALDAATGQTKWRQQLDATASGSPTVFGDLVYITAGDNTGWAVRKSDGRVEWQIGAAADSNNVLGAPAPALSDDLAIFGFGSGEIQAVFRRGGLNRWDASVLGRRPGRALGFVSDVTAAPVIAGDTVYVGNQAGRIAALELASGTRIWTAREGGIGPVWPVGNSVFALTDLNELVRLDASNGAKIWGTPLPNFVKKRPRRQGTVYTHHGPILAGGRIVVASNDGKLRSFNPRDGALLNAVDIPGGATSAPVVAGGVLYVVSTDGKLHAFR